MRNWKIEKCEKLRTERNWNEWQLEYHEKSRTM